MDPDDMQWALVTKGSPDEVRRAAQKVWESEHGAPLTMEVVPLLEGLALVGDSTDIWELLSDWARALAPRLNAEVLALDLRLRHASTSVWTAAPKGRVQGRRRDAFSEAQRVGLFPKPPPTHAIAIVDSAAVREVEEALRHVGWNGLPLVLAPHPRGVLVTTEPPTIAPVGAGRRLRAAFPRVWAAVWFGARRFGVYAWRDTSESSADWGENAWGRNESTLALLGVENSPDAARAALQVDNPPDWKGP